MAIEKNEFELSLPSSKEDRIKFQTFVNQLKASFLRDISEAQNRKTILEDFVEALGKEYCSASDLKNLAKDLATDAFKKKKAKQDAYQDFFVEYISVIEKAKPEGGTNACE